MPDAARISDYHTCPAVNPGPVPHVGGPVTSGSHNVNIAFQPAARLGDTVACVPAVDALTDGSSNVFINRRPAARIGDGTAHGGVIVRGAPSVRIGESPRTRALATAASSGAPFCEECERARRRQLENRDQEPPATATRAQPAPPTPPVDPRALATSNVVDGDPQRAAARRHAAWGFFADHMPDAPPSEVEAYVRTIDLDRPLHVAAPTTDRAAELTSVATDGAKQRLVAEVRR